jgi:hypothetical protein
MLNVAQITRDEVVHADHLPTLREKTLAQMAAQEACPAGDEHARSLTRTYTRKRLGGACHGFLTG